MTKRSKIIRSLVILIMTFLVILSYIYVYTNHNIIISRNISDDVIIFSSQDDYNGFAYTNENMSLGIKDMGKSYFKFMNLDSQNTPHFYLVFKLDGFSPNTKYSVDVEFNFEDLQDDLNNPININVDIIPNIVSEEEDEIVYGKSFVLNNKLNIYNDNELLTTSFEYETDEFNENYLVIDLYKQDAEELEFEIENIKITYKEIYE